MNSSSHDPWSDYDFSPTTNYATRVLWFCAGADPQILNRCPHSERVKYQGLGGVVLATAVLAFLSGSHAFYTVFVPREATVLDDLQQSMSLPTLAFSVVAGLVWALVIFNLDRFVVSSAGKGDGKETISWDEIKNAMPRLLMAVAIALTISKPLEIRIMESEIEAQLELEQRAYQAELDEATENQFADRKAELLNKIEESVQRIDERRTYLESRRSEIQKQRRLLEQEAEGAVGSGIAGRGPAWQDKKENLERMGAELERDKASEEERIGLMEAERDRLKRQLGELNEELDEQKDFNARQAHALDGLAKRIEVGHEISPLIGYALMLLFVLIEVAPILFKLMLTKGPYDYLEQDLKLLTAANMGIEIDGKLVVSPEGLGEELRESLHHAPHARFETEKRRIEVERNLASHALDAFEQRVRKDIDEDVDAFVGVE